VRDGKEYFEGQKEKKGIETGKREDV